MPKSKDEAFALPERSFCPVARSLEILGDKWTLLVIRDLFLGASRYADFLESPEGIPTNILADRLKRLEFLGVISKELYQDNPNRYRYELTVMGRDLMPVLRSLIQWGLQHVPGTEVPATIMAKYRAAESESKGRKK